MIQTSFWATTTAHIFEKYLKSLDNLQRVTDVSPLVSCTDQLDSEGPAGHVLRLQRLLRHDPDVAAANHVQPLGILEYGEPGR